MPHILFYHSYHINSFEMMNSTCAETTSAVFPFVFSYCLLLRHFRFCLTILEYLHDSARNLFILENQTVVLSYALMEQVECKMLIFDEDRPSDSPFVERVWRCHSEGNNPFLSIAASRCELVLGRLQGKVTMTVRGPETKATLIGDCPRDGEWFGIILKLGTFLPSLPVSMLMNAGVDLPTVSRNSFSLFGSTWQLPDYDNADTFADWLMHKGLLIHDPIVDAALHDHLQEYDLRTIQRRFKRSTGLTHGAIRQIERARYATSLLQQDVSILDTVEQAGYFDQSHLTRSLKYFIGQTPDQLLEKSRPEQMSFLYKTTDL